MKKGANFHIEYEYPLRISIKNNNIELIKYLLEKGSDISLLNTNNIIFLLNNNIINNNIINKIKININNYLNNLNNENIINYLNSYFSYKFNKIDTKIKKELINKSNSFNYLL